MPFAHVRASSARHVKHCPNAAMKSRAVGLAVGIVAKGKAGSASFFLGEGVARHREKRKGSSQESLGALAAFLGELVSRIELVGNFHGTIVVELVEK